MAEEPARTWEALTCGEPVVLTAHVDLDGDALGATLALRHALGDRGIESYTIFASPVPQVFEFLPGVEDRVESVEDLPPHYVLVVLDCGFLDRIGSIAEGVKESRCTVNIDHHLNNASFGDINWVETSASSCGELVYRLLDHGGASLTRPIAECLLTAIMTDTGRFTYSNTTEGSIRICGELVAAGASAPELNQRVYCTFTPEQLTLQGSVMLTLRFKGEGRLAIMHVDREMYERLGVRPVDCQGLAELPAWIKSVQVGVLLKEPPDQPYVEVSMRSRDRFNVADVAREFGGGGHYHAAGCEIGRPLAEVEHLVTEAILRRMDQQRE